MNTYQGGPLTIKGVKSLVDIMKTTLFNYFEKSPIIIYNELFVHILGFCLFMHEIDILQIWSHFIMLLESFVIHKTLVDRVFFKDYKI